MSRDSDPRSGSDREAELDRLLDAHPRLDVPPEFAQRVVHAARAERAHGPRPGPGAPELPAATFPAATSRSPRRWTAILIASAAAAALLLWVVLPRFGGGAPAVPPREEPPLARGPSDAPTEGLLEDLDLLLDLELLDAATEDEQLAVLLDVEDPEWVDRALAAWAAQEEGGD